MKNMEMEDIQEMVMEMEEVQMVQMVEDQGVPPEEEDEEESIDPEDDAATRAFKRQTNSLVMLAKSIKELVSKKEDGEYYMDAATGIRKVRKRISPPPLSSKETKERDQKPIY